MSVHRDDAGLLAWVAAAIGSVVIFTQFPQIDLWVSGLFYRAERGFVLADSELLTWLRLRIWDVSRLVMLGAVVGLALAGVTGRSALWLPARVWGAILAVYAIAPGLIVNLWLKSHWGRARPDSVEAFGGLHRFTPPLVPADECARNCSFVSGEGAAAAALLVAAWFALRHLRPRMSRRERRGWLAAAVAVAATGAALRILTGRHFLSDVVFAWLIVIGVALVIDRVLPGRSPCRAEARPLRGSVLTTPATPPIRPET